LLSLTRTNESFTTGIVNLPILFDNDNKPVKYTVIDKKSGKPHTKYQVVPDMRYPFFEVDSMDYTNRILKAYEELKLPVYMHRTMNGYHFLSFVALHRDCYSEWINPLMKYNPKCPMTTLRIRANKWVREYDIFFNGMIYDNGCSTIEFRQLEEFIELFKQQNFVSIGMKYYIVHYRMTGELGNL